MIQKLDVEGNFLFRKMAVIETTPSWNSFCFTPQNKKNKKLNDDCPNYPKTKDSSKRQKNIGDEVLITMVTAIIVENSKTVAAVDHCGRRNHRGVPCGSLLKIGSIAQLVRASDC